jgi:GPH family glycoside/pentoside/hexuronide:cation symporter
LLAYGSGGIIPIALFNIAGQLMGLIGNIGLGLSAFWLGVIMIIPRLWDAVSDPLMGHISDNTRSRFGRRRPFLLLGGIAVALSFVLMWWIPEGELVQRWFSTEASYKWFQLAYILLWLLIFFTACTVFEIPHGALGMEMSNDTHERTRLFSAKSFLGNLFAMGTPWLFFLANLDIFKGPGGNEADGMRWVSMMIAAILIPLVLWWFFACKEPGFTATKAQPKSRFWHDIRITFKNRTFLILVAIFFILGMGFNFVGLLNYYISIFYLFGGDKVAAGPLLGINGTIWAVTGLLAVFPLNWLGKRFGKRKTLAFAILLMCGAQLSKIVCYNPEMPYLVVIPTVLLSAGMLMFFTLGPSMLGDICDEDELNTGTRSEGSYYSIYWWFFKMGTAFASFVTGSLIIFSQFDEKQGTSVDAVSSSLTVLQSEIKEWEINSAPFIIEAHNEVIESKLEVTLEALDALRIHFAERMEMKPETAEHLRAVVADLDILRTKVYELKAESRHYAGKPMALLDSELNTRRLDTLKLAQQSPDTLLLLRIIEISLPLILSIFSLSLTFFYPLSEARCYEIKAELEARRVSSTI